MDDSMSKHFNIAIENSQESENSQDEEEDGSSASSVDNTMLFIDRSNVNSKSK